MPYGPTLGQTQSRHSFYLKGSHEPQHYHSMPPRKGECYSVSQASASISIWVQREKARIRKDRMVRSMVSGVLGAEVCGGQAWGPPTPAQGV